MRPKEVISKYGSCLELISMDPYFNDVTVGLFFKEPFLTVHSYSKKEGLDNRLEEIRNRIVDIAGAVPGDQFNQATFPCSCKDGCCTPPLRFVIKEAVTKDRPNNITEGIKYKDLRSDMILSILNDPRGWSTIENIEFQLVSPEYADFNIIFANFLK